MALVTNNFDVVEEAISQLLPDRPNQGFDMVDGIAVPEDRSVPRFEVDPTQHGGGVFGDDDDDNAWGGAASPWDLTGRDWINWLTDNMFRMEGHNVVDQDGNLISTRKVPELTDEEIANTSIEELLGKTVTPANAERILTAKAKESGITDPQAVSMIVSKGMTSFAQGANPVTVINNAATGVEDFVNDVLDKVNGVIGPIYSKGSEWLTEVIDKVTEKVPIAKILIPNAGTVVNAGTGTVTGTYTIGGGTPPWMQTGSGGLILANPQAGGGIFTSQRGPISVSTGNSVADKILGKVLNGGKIDITKISVPGVLAEILKEAGIPASAAGDVTEAVTKVVEEIKTTVDDDNKKNNVTFTTADPCADWQQWCGDNEEARPDGKGGCECVAKAVVDPCADKTCSEGFEPQANATGGCDCVAKAVVDPCADKTCSKGFEPKANTSGGCDCVPTGAVVEQLQDLTCWDADGNSQDFTQVASCPDAFPYTSDPTEGYSVTDTVQACTDSGGTWDYDNKVCANCPDGKENVFGVCVDKCADNQERKNGVCVDKKAKKTVADPCAGADDCSDGSRPTYNTATDKCECAGSVDPCAGVADCANGSRPTYNKATDKCECAGSVDPCAGADDCSDGSRPTYNKATDKCECTGGSVDPCAGVDNCSDGSRPTYNKATDKCECTGGSVDPCAGVADCANGSRPTYNATTDKCECTGGSVDPCAGVADCSDGSRPTYNKATDKCECTGGSVDPCAGVADCSDGSRPTYNKATDKCECTGGSVDPCAGVDNCSDGSRPTYNKATDKCECTGGSVDPCAGVDNCSDGSRPTYNATTDKCECTGGSVDPCADKTCPTDQEPKANDAGGCDCVPKAVVDPCAGVADCANGSRPTYNATTDKCECAGGSVDPCAGVADCANGSRPTYNTATEKCECTGGGCGDKTCPGAQVLNPVTCKCENPTPPDVCPEGTVRAGTPLPVGKDLFWCNQASLTPCEELTLECEKIGQCADCDAMQCVSCDSGSGCDDPQYAADNLCECYPNHPECQEVVTPSGGGFGFETPTIPVVTPTPVTEEAAELADLGPVFDMFGDSIFNTPVEFDETEEDDLGLLDLNTTYDPYKPYNRGGIVKDYAVDVLLDILRNR